MDIAEIRMLRWTHGVSEMDKIRNEYIKTSLGVTNIAGKIREKRLKWFGHIKRRNIEDTVKKIDEISV